MHNKHKHLCLSAGDAMLPVASCDYAKAWHEEQGAILACTQKQAAVPVKACKGSELANCYMKGRSIFPVADCSKQAEETCQAMLGLPCSVERQNLHFLHWHAQS